MAWTDHAETSQATVTTLSPGIQTHYDQEFLANAIPNLKMMQFADKRPLPRNKGKTITFYRGNPLDVVTTKLTEGTNPTGILVGDHTVTRQIEEWGAWTQYSSYVSATHIDENFNDLSARFGISAGKTIDLRIMKEVVTCGAHSLSADADNAASGDGMRNGQWAVSESGTTASTTTILYAETAVVDGDLIFNDTDNWFIGGQLTGIDGQNMGQTRYVYDSVSATNAMNVYPAWDYAPADADKFIFSHPGKSGDDAAVVHNLAPTDTLTHHVFARTREDLQTYEAPEYEDNYYVFLLGPTTNAGFMTDTDGGWMGLAQYRGKAMWQGEIGKYMGFRVVNTSQPFRCVLPTTAITGGPGATSSTDFSLTGTNYAVGGNGHYSLAFGKGAFAMTMFPGWSSPKMLHKPLGSAGAADPLDMQGSIGWKLPGVPCALNALWCVSVVSGG